MRCPVCHGLRGVHARHGSRNDGVCRDCKQGRVIPRSDFYNYWTARFSPDEILEMAKAIWG